MSVPDNYTSPVAPGSSLYDSAFQNNAFLNSGANTDVSNANRALNAPTPQWKAAQLGSAPQVSSAGVGSANLANVPGVSQSGAQYQQSLLQQLADQANGRGPGQTLAENNARSALQQGTAQQQAFAATNGGRNPALANKVAANGAAGIAANVGSNLQNESLGAQLSGQQGLAALSGQVQGQNLNEANYALGANQFNANNLNNFQLTQAQLEQQARLANQGMAGQYGLTQAGLTQAANSGNAGLQQNQFQLGNSAALGWQGQGLNAYQTAMGNLQAGAGLYNNSQLQTNQLNQTGANANVNNAINGAKAVGGMAVGALTGISDRRAKKGLRSPDDATGSLLQALANSSTYKYKEPERPGRGSGDFTSPMAQELELTEAKRFVHDTPEGKAVEWANPHFIGLMGAAMGNLHKRLENMEKR